MPGRYNTKKGESVVMNTQEETCQKMAFLEEGRRMRGLRRAIFLGGTLAVMLFAPLILLMGTGVEIAQDPHFVPAPQLKEMVRSPSPASSSTPSPDTASALTALSFGSGIPGPTPDMAAGGASFPYTVYVASFRQESRAGAFVERLREEGQLAFSTYLEASGMGGWFRVFCGNYATREAAQRRATQMNKKKGGQASVVEKSVALALDGPISREAAKALECRLYTRGFFAYAMPSSTASTPVQLLVGAFQGETRVQEMQALLADAGFVSRPVKR